MKLFGFTLYGFATGMMAVHFFRISTAGPQGEPWFMVPIAFLAVGFLVELIHFTSNE